MHEAPATLFRTLDSPDFNSRFRPVGKSAFPPLPNIEPTVFNRDEIKSQWPAFWLILEELSSHRRYPDEPMALISSRKQLNNACSSDGYGNALVLLLPTVMEQGLLEFAKQEPYVGNYGVYRCTMETKFVFEGRVGNDEYTFLLPLYPIYCLISGHVNPFWVPHIFVSGSTVVLAGRLMDEREKFGIDITVSYRENRPLMILEEELDDNSEFDAEKNAIVFKDEDYSIQVRHYMKEFRVLEMDESEESTENCCYVDKQSENVDPSDEDDIPW